MYLAERWEKLRGQDPGAGGGRQKTPPHHHHTLVAHSPFIDEPEISCLGEVSQSLEEAGPHCLSHSGVPSGHENFRTLALFPRGPKFISGLNSQVTSLLSHVTDRSGTCKPRPPPPSKTFPPETATARAPATPGLRAFAGGSGGEGRGQLPGALRCDISPVVVQCAKLSGWRGAGNAFRRGETKRRRADSSQPRLPGVLSPVCLPATAR